MVVIFETFDAIQADFLKSQLEDAGIAAHIYSPDVNGLRPSLAFVTPVQVLVLESSRDAALEIVKDLALG